MAGGVESGKLGSDVKIEYQPYGINVCYNSEPIKANSAALARELTLDAAIRKFQAYLDIVAPGNNTRGITLKGETVAAGDGYFSMSGVLACVDLKLYFADTAGTIIKDIDPDERVLAEFPFLTFISSSHTTEIDADNGKTDSKVKESKLNRKTIKVTNHSLPYAMALETLLDGLGFSKDHQFGLFEKCVTQGVLMQVSAETCYKKTHDLVAARKRSSSEQK